EASGVFAWVPRYISWPANELLNSRLGDQGHGEHHEHGTGYSRLGQLGYLRFLPDAVYRIVCGARRPVESAVDRPFSIHSEDEYCRWRCVVWSARGGRDAGDAQQTGDDARRRGTERLRHYFPAPAF